MEAFSRIALVGLLLMGLSACAPAAPATPPVPVDGYYPLATRTGNAEIDPVLAAVEQGNPRALRSLIQFTDAKCTQRDGLGGPPKCRPGEAEGTSVEALPFLGSEGSFLRRDEIEKWEGIDVLGLYSIYEVSPAVSAEQYYPAGEYSVQFLGQEPETSVALRLSAGKIVRADYIFDNSPRAALTALIESEAASFVLPPPVP